VKRVLLVVLLAAFALTGCGGHDNTDPRKGVVYLDDENCITGGCFTVTKVCLGPDLIYRDTRLSNENEERVIENAPECQPDGAP
jgi:hypothetical protein